MTAWSRPMSRSPRAVAPPEAIASVRATSTALPDHRYSQRELATLAARILTSRAEDRVGDDGRSPTRTSALVTRFFERVGVAERRLALPLEAYVELGGLEARSRAWLDVATVLGERAIAAVLDESGLRASDIHLLATTTVTGIAVPSLDARLMNKLPFAPSLTRMPLFGLGCLGGAAGVARVADYLRAYPESAALLLSVELCSLTFQPDDLSVSNLVSTGLFGDGASAVLLLGARHRLAPAPRARPSVRSERTPGVPRIVASRSVFFPDTERVMGWDLVDTGFKVVLSADVPAIVREHIPPALDGFLAEHGLRRADIRSWVVHPGGPKVIDALEESLGLPPSSLAPTRDGLARFGNLSSASVLFLLDEHRRQRAGAPGDYGLMMAMGPAFCAEMVLFAW